MVRAFKHRAALVLADVVPTSGNVFLFLVAGYETTAHTLAYAFILLALHQDEQEAYYQSIKSVLPNGKNPVSARPPFPRTSKSQPILFQKYEDFSSLSYSLACVSSPPSPFNPHFH